MPYSSPMSDQSARPGWTDFSHQTSVHRDPRVRLALQVAGSVSLVLGLIGVFLPVLPTTPFLLLAAFCYARSSAKFYNRLLNNRVFGKYIQDWQRTGAITLKTKIVAIALLLVSVGTSVVFFIPYMPAQILVSAIAVSVAVYIATRPHS